MDFAGVTDGLAVKYGCENISLGLMRSKVLNITSYWHIWRGVDWMSNWSQIIPNTPFSMKYFPWERCGKYGNCSNNKPWKSVCYTSTPTNEPQNQPSRNIYWNALVHITLWICHMLNTAVFKSSYQPSHLWRYVMGYLRVTGDVSV